MKSGGTMDSNNGEERKAFSLLDAWLTEEVLSPQAVPKAEDLKQMRRDLIRYDQYKEPWNEKRLGKRDKEKSVYWMVYLGQIDLKKAMRVFVNQKVDQALT